MIDNESSLLDVDLSIANLNEIILILYTLTQNDCFVSIHVVLRFTHAYRYFVADSDYAIFIQKVSTPEKRVPYVARAEEQMAHYQL